MRFTHAARMKKGFTNGDSGPIRPLHQQPVTRIIGTYNQVEPPYCESSHINFLWTARAFRVPPHDLKIRISLLRGTIVLSEETLEDTRSLICGHGNRTVHKLTCIRTPPDWYNEVIYDEGPI
jgi:hypothetical protein